MLNTNEPCACRWAEPPPPPLLLLPQVSEVPPADEPDLSIRSDHLVDDTEGPGEIKTVTADNSFYTSGGWRSGGALWGGGWGGWGEAVCGGGRCSSS